MSLENGDIEDEPWRTVEYGNLALVRAVKKRPCLYNNTIPEYSQKDVTRAAWEEIAQEFGCSVPICKKRWKNLRLSFIRKKTEQCIKKNTKPYYLDKEMTFILPFIHSNKLLKRLSSVSTVTFNISGEDTNGVVYYEPAVEDTENSLEDVVSEEAIASDNIADNSYSMSDSGKKISTVKPTIINFQRPSFANVKSVQENCEKAPHCIPSNSNPIELQHSPFEEENPRNLFMTSLLPEIHEMSEVEFRVFKRKVFELIDVIRE